MFSQKMKLFFITLFSFVFNINAFAGKLEDSSGNKVYSFLVDNASMVDAYFNIFNAMAMFFQSNDYLELLKVVFLLGGLSVFFVGVMKVYQGGDAKGSLGEFVKYMILGTALLTIIFSHKSQILIQTHKLNTFCPSGNTSNSSVVAADPYVTTGVVVGNIPEVLAWTFSLINEVGRETTRLATMAFTAVDANLTTYTTRSDYASYLQGVGSVLSSDLSKFVKVESNSSSITLLTGLDALFRDCIAAPAANTGTDGSLVMTAFTNTGNLRQTMTDYFVKDQINTYKNPTDTSTIKTLLTVYSVNGVKPKNLLTTVNGNTYTCEQVYNIVNNIFTNLETGNDLTCSGNLKDYWNPETMAIFTGDPNIITEAQGKQIILQAALANQVMDSKNNIAPAELSYASGKSTAEFVTSSLGTGYYMAQMLPYLQMGMRAVMYAFFPFVFIVVLLPGGIKVLISYLQTLIWIELWSPTAAVLNMFLSIMATDKFAEMYQTKGVNATQGLQTFSDAAMLASVAGYLYASVPALTWLILKGSGQMLGNITGAMGARMTANMNSDSINKDLQQISSNKKINEEKRARGEKMISLAEQDKLNAQIGAWEGAATFDQKYQNKDRLFNATSAKEKIDIAKNSANAEYMLDNPNANLHMGALKANVSGQIDQVTAKSLQTGEIGPGGLVNDNKVKKLNTAIGRKEGATEVGTEEYMRGMDQVYGDKVNSAFKSVARNELKEANVKVIEEKTQAKVHNVNPNDPYALVKNNLGIATTTANGNVLNNNVEKAYQSNVLHTDANGNIPNTRETVNAVSAGLGAGKAVDTKTAMGMFSHFSNAERVAAALSKNSAEMGKNLELVNSLGAGLGIVANDNNNPDSAKAQKLLNVLTNSKSSQSAKLHAISEASGMKSVIGAAAQVFLNRSGDINAKNLTDAGLGATATGTISAASEVSKNTGSGGFGNGTGGIYNELNTHTDGKKALEDAKKIFNVSDKDLNQYQTDKEGNFIKDSEGNKLLTADSINNRRILANNAQEMIKAKPQAYNALVDDGVLKFKKEHTNLEQEVTGTGFQKSVDSIVNSTIYDYTGVEAYAGLEIGKKVISIAKMPVDTVKVLEDLNKKVPGLSKVTTGFKNFVVNQGDTLNNIALMDMDRPEKPNGTTKPTKSRK